MESQQGPEDHPIERVLNTGEAAVVALRRFFSGYFWFIFKNVAGWLLILFSPILGVTVPGPGGIPVFLIGFALVTFPGKRKLTSHFLRGRPVLIEASIFVAFTTIVSIAVIGFIIWFAGERYTALMAYFNLDPKTSTPGFVAAVAGACVLAALITYGVMKLSLLFVNRLIRVIPRIRRMARPFLRKWGIVLLPPSKRSADGETKVDGEILELSQTSKDRVSRWWQIGLPWLSRFFRFGFMGLMLFFVIEPIKNGWREAGRLVNLIYPFEFIAAIFLCAGFIYAFRIFPWWMLLRVFGHELDGPTASRVWITSELSNWSPGANWKILQRSFLLRPNGVPSITCDTSQIIERVLFTAAVTVFSVICLALLGIRKAVDPNTRFWMIAAISTMPFMLALLHPRFFFSIVNRVLVYSHKPRLQTNVRGGTLAAMLVWMIGGMAFLSVAIWLMVSSPLGLPLGKWWLVGGIYCIAWLAGIAAFFLPGGLGVREVVFMILLPEAVRPFVGHHFDPAHPENLYAFSAILALLLRVWSMAGSLIVTIFAYIFDFEGALRSFRPTGRVK